MINKDGFCGHCRTYHRPDPRYWNDCPNPFVPLERASQPSIEEQHARNILQIEAEIYQDNQKRQREAEKAARQNIREEAKAQDTMKTVHQLQKEAREQATAKVLAEQEAIRKQLLMPVQAERQVNRLTDREKETNQKRAAEQAPVQRQAGRLQRRHAQRAGQRGGR
jgi:hypothetical protein